MSDVTKGYKKKYRLYQILSLLLLFLPVGIFIVIAFFRGTVTQKTTLGVGVTLSAIFMVANAMFKLAPRSGVWILIMALAVAIQKIQNVIYITGACVIIEECVTSKLEQYYKDKFKINKEIDERFEIKEQADGTGKSNNDKT